MGIFSNELSQQDIERVRRAADYAGLPWRAISRRPQAARQFSKRVEAEKKRYGQLEELPVSGQNTRKGFAQRLAALIPFHPDGFLYRTAALAASHKY